MNNINNKEQQTIAEGNLPTGDPVNEVNVPQTLLQVFDYMS